MAITGTWSVTETLIYPDKTRKLTYDLGLTEESGLVSGRLINGHPSYRGGEISGRYVADDQLLIFTWRIVYPDFGLVAFTYSARYSADKVGNHFLDGFFHDVMPAVEQPQGWTDENGVPYVHRWQAQRKPRYFTDEQAKALREFFEALKVSRS